MLIHKQYRVFCCNFRAKHWAKEKWWHSQLTTCFSTEKIHNKVRHFWGDVLFGTVCVCVVAAISAPH